MKKIKKTLSILLICILSFTSQVFAATSAKFDGNKYCTATISQKLMKNKRYKKASVKVTAYNSRGRKVSGKINITLTDGNGNHIGTYTKNSGDTIKLGNDHSGYRIYVSRYTKSAKGFWEEVIFSANNLTDLEKFYTWKITNNKDCSIR